MSIHDGHRQRLKQAFLAARRESFHDHQLLELLLFYAIPQKDTNPLAHELMNRFGSLHGVLDAPVEELCKVNGIGEHAAVLIKLIKTLGGRYQAGRASMSGIIRTTADACQALEGCFYGARNEMVYLLCMDGKYKLLGVRKVCEGSVHAAEVSTRLIVEAALSLNAAAVILAHNHVSGIAFPSAEDCVTTNYLYGVLKQLDIKLCDHIIFVDDDAVSLRDSGKFTPKE